MIIAYWLRSIFRRPQKYPSSPMLSEHIIPTGPMTTDIALDAVV
jgi:hypothetical protein